MPNDIFARGAIAGILASIPMLLLDQVFVQTGIAQWHRYQIAAGIFMNAGEIQGLLGLIYGLIVMLMPAILLGIILILVFRFTGREYWWLKGPCITIWLMHICVYGLLFSLGAAQIVPRDLHSSMAKLIGDGVFGITLGYLLARFSKRAMG